MHWYPASKCLDWCRQLLYTTLKHSTSVYTELFFTPCVGRVIGMPRPAHMYMCNARLGSDLGFLDGVGYVSPIRWKSQLGDIYGS